MKLRNLLLLVLLSCATLGAQVTLPKILSSHMVMQRDLPVHVWGMAAPEEDVRVSFRGETRTPRPADWAAGASTSSRARRAAHLN